MKAVWRQEKNFSPETWAIQNILLFFEYWVWTVFGLAQSSCQHFMAEILPPYLENWQLKSLDNLYDLGLRPKPTPRLHVLVIVLQPYNHKPHFYCVLILQISQKYSFKHYSQIHQIGAKDIGLFIRGYVCWTMLSSQYRLSFRIILLKKTTHVMYVSWAKDTYLQVSFQEPSVKESHARHL